MKRFWYECILKERKVSKNMYLSVEVENSALEGELRDEVIFMACNEWGCCGVQEADLSEDAIDNLIGADAFCGGNLREDLLVSLECAYGEVTSFVFKNKEHDGYESFVKFLQIKDIKYKVIKIKNNDWNEQWRKHYSPIEITSNFKILPSWQKNCDDLENVFIYPGMGFGTGDHSTTYLCLKLFEKYRTELNKNSKVLDLGCGSGILGISASKLLKLDDVVFCDIDKDALENCKQNIKLNELLIKDHNLILRKDLNINKYDLVFANILLNVLEEELPLILSSVKKGGICIMSGILEEQLDRILGLYRELKIEEILIKDGWAAILFINK